ncbi:MAG: GldG family protein [Spirochaetia bacterium]|nr:GldG family protein [Spirochaetia bacterium]
MKAILAQLNHSRGFIYANVIVLFLLANGVGSAWNCRWDLSRDRVNSVTPSTLKVLGSLKDPVLVEAYVTTDLPGELKSVISPIMSQLDEIGRVGGRKVKLRIINPDSDEKRQAAEQRGLQGTPFEQARVDEVSQRLGYFGVYVQTGDKSAILNLVDEGRIIEDFEFRFLREIKRLTRKEGPSGLGYVKVPGTSDTRRWQSFQDQDKDNMYFFRSLLEEEFGAIPNVELNAPVESEVETLLIVGQPRLDEKQAYHLDQFIMRGGNLICLLKGFDFDLQPVDQRMARYGVGGQGRGFANVNREDLDRLNRFFAHYGIAVNGQILFEPTLSAPEMDIQGQYVQRVRNPAWAIYSRETGNIVSESASIRNIQQIILPWFSGLEIKADAQPNVKFTPLLVSSPDAIAKESSPIGLKEMQGIGGQPGDVGIGKPEPLAVIAQGRFQSAFTEKDVPKGEDKSLFRGGQSGATQSSILVLGTPYLVSDIFLRNEANLQIFKINQAFVLNLIESAQGDVDLSEARARVQGIDVLRPIFAGDEKASKWFERLFTWFHVLFIPVILAFYGWRRLSKRNQRRGLEVAR